MGTERRALASCSNFWKQDRIRFNPGSSRAFLRGNSAQLGANYVVLHFSLGANLPGRSSAAPRATSTIHSTPQTLGKSPPPFVPFPSSLIHPPPPPPVKIVLAMQGKAGEEKKRGLFKYVTRSQCWNFKLSMGARNRVGIGLLYRPATHYTAWRNWFL
jgi:hypothetical protein